MALPACVVGVHGIAITSSRWRCLPVWLVSMELPSPAAGLGGSSSDLWLRVEDDQHRKVARVNHVCMLVHPSSGSMVNTKRLGQLLLLPRRAKPSILITPPTTIQMLYSLLSQNIIAGYLF
jgi:hypothetical protein